MFFILLEIYNLIKKLILYYLLFIITLMTMEDYRRFVHALAETKINQIFLNSDNDKMLSVFIEMFNVSEREFRIYASNLCNDITNSKEYIEAISNFIEKKGKLYILLNNFHQEQAIFHNLFKRLAYYQSLDGYNIFIKSTTKEILYDEKPAHLAIGDDKCYRIETDINKRTAICNMADSDYSKKLVSFFDDLFEDEENLVIDLVKIFNIRK